MFHPGDIKIPDRFKLSARVGSDDLVPYTRVAIEGIRAGRLYSETGWA
ncbi:hypothetical protein ACFQ7M_19655 [Streptomyces massasporeus]